MEDNIKEMYARARDAFKEVEFWSDYGYDPRLVWDGFKMTEENAQPEKITQDVVV